MRQSLFFCLLAVMTFLLTACSMQSPEADLSAVDANTERVSNNTTQPRVSNEPVLDGTENPISTDVPSAETQPGDIVLYSGNQLVIFFGSNSWSYTRLGHIDGLSTDELTALLDKDIAVIEIKNG